MNEEKFVKKSIDLIAEIYTYNLIYGPTYTMLILETQLNLLKEEHEKFKNTQAKFGHLSLSPES